MITINVKGNRTVAEDIANRRGIDVEFIRTITTKTHETTVLKADDGYLYQIQNWFSEDSYFQAPYKTGSCLLYSIHKEE